MREITLEGKPPIPKLLEIKEESFKYFQDLYSSKGILNNGKAKEFLSSSLSNITEEENQYLMQEIAEEEVIDAIWSLDLDKAP